MALAANARQRDDREMERWVTEIKLRAGVRIGELSKALEKAPRGGKGGTTKLPSGGKNAKAAALKAAGISTSVAHRCEELTTVCSTNLMHRDLTSAQRTMLAAKIYPEGKRTGRGNKSPVSVRTLDSGALSKARLVLRVLPELAEAVIKGETMLNAAYEQATAAQAERPCRALRRSLCAAATALQLLRRDHDAVSLGWQYRLPNKRREPALRTPAKRLTITSKEMLTMAIASITPSVRKATTAPHPGVIRYTRRHGLRVALNHGIPYPATAPEKIAAAASILAAVMAAHADENISREDYTILRVVQTLLEEATAQLQSGTADAEVGHG